MRILRYGAVLLFFVSLWGCSNANDRNTILDASGKHPANWVTNHAGLFRSLSGAIDDPAVATSSACTECHGSDLQGGVSKVSCFSQSFGAMTCHFHPAGYRNGNSHGKVAKSATTFSSGFDSCRGCHGSQYMGGTLSVVSCSSASSLTDPAFACHGVNAPHAGKWASSTTSDHSTSDTSNAAACYQCHAAGNFLTSLPAPPPQPAGTPPGCFNNTLCHSGRHPSGWITPAQHGAAAKSQPGTGLGFNSCQSCHGTDFKGAATGVSCFSASSPNGSCHLRNGAPVNAPHSALPWRAAPPLPTHTSTVDDAQGLNAKVCAQCHLRGANLRTAIITSYASGTPGCFNSTLCHGVQGHPAGWANPGQHGTQAKANLTYCQTCHSNNPGGGPGSNPRFNVVLGRLTAGCETCHLVNTAHPPVMQIPAAFGITSPDPLDTPWFRHRTATNFDACNRCHGANLEGGVGPRCQNCHVAALPTSTVNSPDPCSSCHSQPPSGTVYPNINRVHGSHAVLNVPTGGVCTECHAGLGSGTLDHFLRASNVATGAATSTQPNAVVFGGVLSTVNGATPVFTLATFTCTNTYCHGATMASNTSNPPASRVVTPAWNAPFLGIASVVGNGSTTPGSGDCATCHGYPPMIAPHAGLLATDCVGCHTHVNASGTGFSAPAKHINGVVDVSSGGGGAPPHLVPNLTHNATADFTPCLGCHPNSTTAAVYPNPTAGAAPNCRGCHTLADPLAAGNGLGNCKSCHGTGGTGTLATPSNTSSTATNFPNIQRSHPFTSHHGGSPLPTCGTCHAGVTSTGFADGVSAIQSGSGAGVNHGPNKTMTSGATQTNIVKIKSGNGITLNATRGNGATCNHSVIASGCGGGSQGVKSW